MSTWTWRQGPGEWSDRSGQGPSSQPQWQVQLYDKTQVLGAHLKSLKNHSSPTTAELQCMTDSGKASLGQACWHPVQEALLPEQPSGLSCPCGLLLHLGPPASPAAACVLCPWDSPGKNTGVGYNSLLQKISSTQGANPDLLHCRWILYCISLQGTLILKHTRSY